MGLRTIGTFIDPVDARSAAELTRQLVAFEENVARETDAIRTAKQERLRATARATRANAELAPGEQLGLDTTAGDLRVLLARPTATLAGLFAAVVKRVAANNVVIATPAGVTINGASSLTRAAVGLQLIYCDGVEYWA